MIIYIISNYYNIDINLFKIIKPNDLVVFMNHCFNDGPFFDNNKKILFIRKNAISYFGYKDNYNNRYKEIYFVNGNLNDKELLNNVDTCSKILINEENIIKNYPKNKFPTTGFIAYFYMKNKFPKARIFLIGFTGGSSNTNQVISIMHDYKYEQEYYKKNNVKLLNKEHNKENNVILLLLNKYKK